jgi:hypothetical protein
VAMFDKTKEDLTAIIEKNSLDPVLHDLDKSLKRYAKSRKIDNVPERVQLIFIIGAILDVKQDEFEEMINRINRIIIKNQTGFEINELVNAAELVLRKPGRIN